MKTQKFTTKPGNSLDDLEHILKRARDNDDQAIETLYLHYHEKVYRFIFYRVSHRETAEDLTEEVFVKIFKNLRKLEKAKAFEGWMFRIARNRVIDYYRSKKTVVSITEVENTLEYETNVVDIVNLQVNQQIFIKLLKELTPEQQSVVKMRFLEDLDTDVIAETLQKTEGAARVIQHRALTKLKQLVEDHISNIKDDE